MAENVYLRTKRLAPDYVQKAEGLLYRLDNQDIVLIEANYDFSKRSRDGRKVKKGFFTLTSLRDIHGKETEVDEKVKADIEHYLLTDLAAACSQGEIRTKEWGNISLDVPNGTIELIQEGNMAKVWLNGKLIPEEEAHFPLNTHALHYGSGVFEGIRAYETPKGTGIFRLGDHLERFENSGRPYKMALPYSQTELAEAIWDTIEANGINACYIRPIAFRGEGPLGIYPMQSAVNVAIMVWQWGAYLGEEGIKNGIRATMSPYRRFSNDMMPSASKATGQYLNSILAKIESKERGFEEAILLNERGLVCEGTGENIFIVKDNTVLTPRISDSILPGITRKTVLEICEKEGIQAQEAPISKEMLFAADEVFVTGTAAEVTPVRSIDEHPIGSNMSITKRIQEIFSATVQGEETQFSHLLTYRA